MITFEEAIAKSKGQEVNLLCGNGFSAKYFNYRTLLAEAGLDDKEPLRQLFDALDTSDFEMVIRSLEDAARVTEVYGNKDGALAFIADAQRLREALVKAIRNTHPEHRENIEADFPPCVRFLGRFSNIFTLNYDLLLYWVLLPVKGFSDGFGLGDQKNGFIGPFKEGAHCNTYNLHGGLHLFETAIGEVEKRLMENTGVIDAIAKTIAQDKRLPLYVAEGTSVAKLARINSVPYLRHCLKQLRECNGILFVFGHSAANNDAHIYEAVFGSNIDHIYFVVYQPDVDKLKQTDAQLSKFQKRAGSIVGYSMIDAATVPVWE